MFILYNRWCLLNLKKRIFSIKLSKKNNYLASFITLEIDKNKKLENDKENAYI